MRLAWHWLAIRHEQDLELEQPLEFVAPSDAECPPRGDPGVALDDEVTPVIDRTYPLSQVAEATRYVEPGRAKGKVVITV